MTRTPAKVTQADLARALRAAKQTGGDWCVEAMPDGTIRIVPVDSVKHQGEDIDGEKEVVL